MKVPNIFSSCTSTTKYSDPENPRSRSISSWNRKSNRRIAWNIRGDANRSRIYLGWREVFPCKLSEKASGRWWSCWIVFWEGLRKAQAMALHAVLTIRPMSSIVHLYTFCFQSSLDLLELAKSISNLLTGIMAEIYVWSVCPYHTWIRSAEAAIESELKKKKLPPKKSVAKSITRRYIKKASVYTKILWIALTLFSPLQLKLKRYG